MHLFLDNDSIDTDATTLGQALAEARTHLGDSGRVIVEVRVDGQTVPEQELSDRHDAQIAGEEVHLITADPRELARQALSDLSRALQANADKQRHAAALLRDDQAPQALDEVRESLNVWSQAQQAILQSAQLLSLPLDDWQVDGRSIPQIVEELAEQLRAVREQLIATDWVGLADSMEYELVDSIETWTRMVEEVMRRIEDE